MSSDNLKPWTSTNVVGKSLPRIDAYERVSGCATYTADVNLPGMLYAAILRCPHAHANVKRVDVSRAAKMPGVRAVLTPASPGAEIPWYAGNQGPLSRLLDPHCRYEGEEVAAVAADTPYQVHDALRAIQVEYEVLPFVTEAEKALDGKAPAVHTGGNMLGKPDVYERGNLAAGFAAADVVLEETYRTPCEIHTPLEVHGSVARWDGTNKLTVWDTTQALFDVQSALAQALKMPLSHVRVISHYMGSGFGSKLELNKHTVIAALLAKAAGQPVKLMLSREETFLAVGNRPGNTITLKAGVKKDGTLTALSLKNVGAIGAYPEDASVGYQVTDLYLCPNVRTEESNVYINAGRARAFRAPGFPQCSWALEQMMDALAEKIGMDPVEFRLKNFAEMSQRNENHPYTSKGLNRCLTEGAKAFGWNEARARQKLSGDILHGVGVASCMWGWGGAPPATAIVRLFADGSVNLNLGAADLGTGTKTVMAMVVAEELGVPLENIEIEHSDTATSPYAQASGGSQTVVVNAPAVREAAIAVKKQIVDLAAAEMKRPAAGLVLSGGKVIPQDEPDKGIALSALKGLGQQSMLVGVGYRHPYPEGKVPLPFAAQFAEVEVNRRTGEVRVVRLVAAHDSGRPMNALTYENQVFGGMTMAIGFATTEARVLDSGQTGKMVNANWHDYKLPTAADVPVDQTCLPIDPHDTECNNTGAKGLGEPATIPGAAAIANAVYHATGIRVTVPSINPTQMARLLAERKGARRVS